MHSGYSIIYRLGLAASFTQIGTCGIEIYVI